MTERWKPHVTVAAIIEREGRFLLVEEHTSEGLRLNNPAGHLEYGETPLAACQREVMEETAHPFTPTALVGIYLWCKSVDITYLRLTYCGSVGAPNPHLGLDIGIVAIHWLSLVDIHANTHRLRSPLVLRGIQDYLAGRRLPLDSVLSIL
ncbi:NUDIX hydrolase [Curvibacter sp. CHRR-16]|uniref:NUDIX hydrolase n=1 Tax=Curvibacter sp. CHRR-16 TaxID=2835872 RepID=UPI001BDAB1D6|nr:NUDIX hydrolase [Curvibacter sp. CHRR-16]MBT0570451.1 NUDIX hydrolase [Curvibacter sp. CHRR-16]